MKSLVLEIEAQRKYTKWLIRAEKIRRMFVAAESPIPEVLERCFPDRTTELDNPETRAGVGEVGE